MPKYIIYNQESSKGKILDIIGDIKSEIPLDDEACFNVRLVLSELIKNSFEHSGSGDKVNVWMDADSENEEVKFRIQDFGTGFNREAAQLEPCHDKIFNSRGRGLMIVHGLCKDVAYNEIGNEVEVVLKT